MPAVSVIIPAYNAEAYIEQCAASVFAQTLGDLEVIFIDDGSTDRTGAILDRLTEGRPGSYVIHQSNGGLYQARKAGLARATGDYVGWVDADDFIEPDMYRKLYAAALEKGSELAYCDYDWYPKKTGTKEKWFRPFKGRVDTSFVERNSQPWNKLVKRSLMERLEIGRYFEACFDEIYILLLMEAKNPVSIGEKLYHYRVGESSMSGSYTNVGHYRRFVDASYALRKLMRTKKNDAYWNDYFDYRVIYYLLMTMTVASHAGDRASYEKNRRELLNAFPAYRRNQHFRRILTENFGAAKAAAIGLLVPAGYRICRFVSGIGFGKR